MAGEETGGEGATNVERIVLEVIAPVEQLSAPDSGLNYAIRRLEKVNLLLTEATEKYRLFTGVSSSAAAGVTTAGPAGAGATQAGNQLMLQPQPQKMEAKPTDKVSLLVPAASITASVEGRISLLIPASQITALVEGPISAIAAAGLKQAGSKAGTTPITPDPRQGLLTLPAGEKPAPEQHRPQPFLHEPDPSKKQDPIHVEIPQEKPVPVEVRVPPTPPGGTPPTVPGTTPPAGDSGRLISKRTITSFDKDDKALPAIEEFKRAVNEFGTITKTTTTTKDEAGKQRIVKTVDETKAAQSISKQIESSLTEKRTEVLKTHKEATDKPGTSRADLLRTEAEGFEVIATHLKGLATLRRVDLENSGQQVLHSKLLKQAAEAEAAASAKRRTLRTTEEKTGIAKQISTTKAESFKKLKEETEFFSGDKETLARSQAEHFKRLSEGYGRAKTQTTDETLRPRLAESQEKFALKSTEYSQKAAKIKETTERTTREEATAESVTEATRRIDADKLRRTRRINQIQTEIGKQEEEVKTILDRETLAAAGNKVKIAKAQANAQRKLASIYEQAGQRVEATPRGAVPKAGTPLSTTEAARPPGTPEPLPPRRALSGREQDFLSGIRSKQTEAQLRSNEATLRGADAQKKFDESSRLIGKNMLQNIAHVTAWGASVGVLYGTLGLLRAGLSSTIELGFQQARLGQVFRGAQGDARALTDDIMRLAGAEGRGTKEAMDSAIQWSRLGLNRQQVNEATRQSLVAANVAEVSAGEATEFLSSIMQVYGLRVGDLGKLLGELNSISNTYNVTNKDLFDGLSRTAAIAKQAGIPLEELNGIIASGVGATGQTGSNIGNALKSVIGSLTTPDTAKALREQYDIEVTTKGGDDMKTMSAILADMFVKYTEMSAAEQKSMIFTVAGKNQASRMAAILNNYVRGQVLAINSQLALNSAELENAAIRKTMKSQLESLISEWERFVKKQGDRTAIPVLQTTTTMLYNVLRLLNTDIGSGIATTIGVIFAGVGAKLALTAVSMGQIGKKGDIVRNTWAALTGTFTAVGQAFTRMSTGLGPGVVTKHIKPLSAALSGIANSTRIASTFTVSPSGGVVPLKVLSEVEAKAKLASRGLKAAQLGTTLLSGALFGLADVIIPLAIVVGVVWSINKAITALGLNSVKVNDQLSQLGIREQKHEGAAKAGGTAARLFTTASEAVTQAHTTPKKLKILKDTAEAAYGNEPDTDVRKKKIEALQAEFEQLYKNLGATEATERAKKLLTEQTTAALAHQATERRKAYEADVATDENLKDQIEDWKTGMLKQGYTPEKRKEKIKELEGQRSANADKRTIKTFEEMETNANDLKLFLEADQKHQVFLEKQKVLVQSISDIYAQMPHEGQTDTLNNEILKLETTLNLHTAILALIREEKAKREASGKDTRTDDALAAEIGRNEEAASTNRSRVRQNLKYAVAKNPSMLDTDAFTDEAGQPDEEKIRKFKTSIEGAPGFLKGSGAGEISKALGYALSQLEEIKKQETIILDLRTKQKDTVQLDSNKRIKGMEDASRKAKEENENQLEAKRIVAATQATNLIDRRGLAVDFAKAESESFQIGGTEGEQLVAQKKALEESISTKGARVDKGLDQKFNAKELAENLAQQKDEMQALAAAKQKLDNLMANSRGKGFEFPGFQGGEVAFHEGRLRGGLATEEAEIRSRPDKGETDNLINTIIQHRIALVDNLIRGNLTLVNLGKEEKNLMIEKNREQARALLTAGPGELLRKLALSQLQRTKPFSTGQFMALDPGARQDVLNEPANSKEIKDNRLSQEVLRGAGFTGLSGLQAAQAAKEKMAADNKINSKQLDSIDINETARKAVGQFATNTNLASTAVKEHTDTLVKSTEQIKNLFQHRPARSGASGSWDAPEGVAQAK